MSRIINKATMPTGHVSPKRWMKYVARNPSVVKVSNSQRLKHMHSSWRKPFDIRDNTTDTLLGE